MMIAIYIHLKQTLFILRLILLFKFLDVLSAEWDDVLEWDNCGKYFINKDNGRT